MKQSFYSKSISNCLRQNGRTQPVCPGENYCKFFPNITGDEIPRPSDRSLECPGNLSKTIIARQVTINIVVLFEVIDIDEQE
jgi:hypothetical protein